MEFKQHKIVILCRFILWDSDEKDKNIEQLDNTIYIWTYNYMVTKYEDRKMLSYKYFQVGTYPRHMLMNPLLDGFLYKIEGKKP